MSKELVILEREEEKNNSNYLKIHDALEEVKEEEEKMSYLLQKSQFIGCLCPARILVVDDTAFNIIPIRAMLKDHFNIDIEIAENGL